MNYYESELEQSHTMNDMETLSLKIYGNNINTKVLNINLESIPEIIRFLNKVKIDLQNNVD